MNTGNICYDYLYDLIEIKYITKERLKKLNEEISKIKLQLLEDILEG